MNLLDIYNALAKGQVTEEGAAAALGLTLKDFRFRRTRFGARLPGTLAVLDQIAAGTLDREGAAEQLGVSLRQVNYLMKNWRVVRPLPEYLVHEALAEVKWEIRKKFAIEFIRGGVQIEEMAEKAGVSERQMRRWVSELLVKHFEMPWKDLKLVGPLRRGEMAREIEQAEGLEHGKQAVIQAIARGQATITDEVAARLAGNRKAKGRVNVQRIESAVIRGRKGGKSAPGA